MPFENFSSWRGRLPHWRADNVTYFVTFRHRRNLDEAERLELFRTILRGARSKLEFVGLCVISDRTELIFTVKKGPHGAAVEFSKSLESAKRKTGKKIMHNTGERYSPFWEESFDRIIRDEAEFAERLQELIEMPVKAELCEDPEDFPTLCVPLPG